MALSIEFLGLFKSFLKRKFFMHHSFRSLSFFGEKKLPMNHQPFFSGFSGFLPSLAHDPKKKTIIQSVTKPMSPPYYKPETCFVPPEKNIHNVYNVNNSSSLEDNGSLNPLAYSLLFDTPLKKKGPQKKNTTSKKYQILINIFYK